MPSKTDTTAIQEATELVCDSIVAAFVFDQEVRRACAIWQASHREEKSADAQDDDMVDKLASKLYEAGCELWRAYHVCFQAVLHPAVVPEMRLSTDLPATIDDKFWAQSYLECGLAYAYENLRTLLPSDFEAPDVRTGIKSFGPGSEPAFDREGLRSCISNDWLWHWDEDLDELNAGISRGLLFSMMAILKESQRATGQIAPFATAFPEVLKQSDIDPTQPEMPRRGTLAFRIVQRLQRGDSAEQVVALLKAKPGTVQKNAVRYAHLIPTSDNL